MKAWSRHPGILALGIAILTLASAAPVLGQQASYYVLDGFGGVHAGGGAPTIPATPYFGFDIAKGIAYVPGQIGNGILVLDGFGGVHRVGLGKPVAPTPYFGFNIARAITYRNVPPRAANESGSAVINLTTSATYTVIESVAITAPDDGFLLVLGSAFMGCYGDASDALAARLTINVDATTEPAAIASMGIATWPDCQAAPSVIQTDNQTLTHLFPVSAGTHTVTLLARKSGGTGGLRVLARSLTAVFIDHNGLGSS